MAGGLSQRNSDMIEQEAEEATSEVIVQLLNPSQGGVLKAWRFRNQTSISIGRADDRDVEVVDAYVSRTHAVLEARDGKWVLVSHGRNGVYVDNRPIDELIIGREVKFRLGSSGPLLAFQTSSARDENLATLSLDTLPVSFFAVDEERLEADVGAIAGREDFLRLQEQASALRMRKQAR
jgi:pSer/pThr/pTyr-binding forkhead associated (FHA) protein